MPFGYQDVTSLPELSSTNLRGEPTLTIQALYEERRKKQNLNLLELSDLKDNISEAVEPKPTSTMFITEIDNPVDPANENKAVVKAQVK